MHDALLGGQPVRFPCGLSMKNQFMLAPMTNCQSHEDGVLSDAEFRWLTMRAEGGFGLTMTCAAHVQEVGQGFPGQLGIFADRHDEGHRHLAAAIKAQGSLAVIQLHHAGLRSPEDLIGQIPVAPSSDAKSGARALTLEGVVELRDDFIAAAVRAQNAGYDGVQIHGAHGYIIAQFISEQYNRRSDAYGGSLEDRSRLLLEIVRGVREACGPDFLLGVRLSPERFGMRLKETLKLSQVLIDTGLIDFLDLSLWDCFKQPEEAEHTHHSLLDHIAGLTMGDVRLTVAGKIHSGSDVRAVLDAGVDFVTIGRAAILHHDYPHQILADARFEPLQLPVSVAHLESEGLSEVFIEYMRRWPDFVAG
jgi:2,4-dienoyl-CoA reductase-like NADH-dependent reductase (Old Yellow Enzyme family)